MTDIAYSPDTACAVCTGIDSAGYVQVPGSVNPSWGMPVALYNNQRIEAGASLRANDALRGELATRQLIRHVAGITLPTLSVLAVGDSITMGTGSVDMTGYAGMLPVLLDRLGVNATVTRCAQGGYTLREIEPLVPAALTASNPDIVLVTLGTNDAAQPDLVDWQNRCSTFVYGTLLAFSTRVKVVIARPAISMPSWSTGEVTIGGYVDAIVAADTTGRVKSADMTVVPATGTMEGWHPRDPWHLLMAQQYTDTMEKAGWLPA